MKVFSYVLKTVTGDIEHRLLVDKDYLTAAEFMKNEVHWEYEKWKKSGVDDDNIGFEFFDRQFVDTETK